MGLSANKRISWHFNQAANTHHKRTGTPFTRPNKAELNRWNRQREGKNETEIQFFLLNLP